MLMKLEYLEMEQKIKQELDREREKSEEKLKKMLQERRLKRLQMKVYGSNMIMKKDL